MYNSIQVVDRTSLVCGITARSVPLWRRGRAAGREESGDERRGGVLVRDGELEIVRDIEIDTDYEDNGLYHRALRIALTTDKGEKLEIEGEVKGFIPLRNRREGMTTHIGEGMTEWRCGDQVGYGLSELLRQVG